MVKLSISLITIVLLLGCTSKKEKDLMQVYNEKSNYHKQLQKTEKTQLYKNGVTQVMLTATYLFTQNFKKKDARDEVFIVGLHLEDESYKTFNTAEYNLTLNGNMPKEVKILSLNDERLKDIPFVTESGNYYFITFPHVKSKDFMLLFESESYGKGELHFSKRAKYVLSKEAF
ncbi:MAG: hypothetical protein OQK45_08420 [Sulfurovum sp.]|nr:hypothetical protein [Sulfurovum sp.]